MFRNDYTRTSDGAAAKVAFMNRDPLAYFAVSMLAGAYMEHGGISKRIFPEEGHIQRAPNVSNIHDYLTRTDEMIQRKRELFLK